MDVIGEPARVRGVGAVLVTGAAGFIGMHVARELLRRGDRVVGVDNLDPYYDVRLKQARLDVLHADARFTFVRADIATRDHLAVVVERHRVDRVVHLAAQAGVRHSIDHPHSYVGANLVGFLNVLEACRHHRVSHLVYASSSSVYGGGGGGAQREDLPADEPVSLYAATKRANELMAHAYSHLYQVPTTGLRFFTVYGPMGRPDMAPYLFTDAIAHGRPVRLFNGGRMMRDFTYVDDVVAGVLGALDRPPASRADGAAVPYRIFNIGNSDPVDLNRFVAAIERALGRRALRIPAPMQPGDVEMTHADISRLATWCRYRPAVTIEAGMQRFVDWYLDYHREDPADLAV